ncbi:hypothetical protein QTH90_21375 [Variovorax sp. J2P1-59]|uniref:hypothetical protein n=1 Tax=Variovorax flavidus TaxID=3053501 RepID=UPI002576F09D|nr:hypothetical protein [Variovorax sp. J2P1-59]MDM0076975.1 hypothetical protein [Variovorax sp. J2P1-59]
MKRPARRFGRIRPEAVSRLDGLTGPSNLFDGRGINQFWRAMRFVRWFTALASIALAGCFASKPVEVRITPSDYQVNKVKSAIATTVVDEVLRIKPRRVLIVACRATRPPKIIQFEQELRARHPDVELTLTLAEQGCPSA